MKIGTKNILVTSRKIEIISGGTSRDTTKIIFSSYETVHNRL